MAIINLFPLSQSWTDFPSIINRELSSLKLDSVIIEIGGGANPCLSKDQVKNLQYIVIDIDQNELSKAKGNYFQKICADITKDKLMIKCDLMISNMLLEHIQNPKEFHKACYEILKINGKAVHFFATKYSPASVINLLLPEYLSSKLLYAIQKRNWVTEGKFPAYYRWCFGPTKEQIKNFQSINYGVEMFSGYLGSSYLSSFTYLKYLESVYNSIIIWLNRPFFCSNAIVVLQKNPTN